MPVTFKGFFFAGAFGAWIVHRQAVSAAKARRAAALAEWKRIEAELFAIEYDDGTKARPPHP